jgi:hypothetical protein
MAVREATGFLDRPDRAIRGSALPRSGLLGLPPEGQPCGGLLRNPSNPLRIA